MPISCGSVGNVEMAERVEWHAKGTVGEGEPGKLLAGAAGDAPGGAPDGPASVLSIE